MVQDNWNKESKYPTEVSTITYKVLINALINTRNSLYGNILLVLSDHSNFALVGGGCGLSFLRSVSS